MSRLRISRAALNDLRAIESHSLKVFGLSGTIDYLEALQSSFRLLLTHPEIGAAYNELARDLRGLGCGSHRIFYRQDGAEILIVRILHGRQDHRRVLGETR